MDKRIDLSTLHELLLSGEFKDIRSDLNKFGNCDYHFYYDESNNIRKLWSRNEGFNALIILMTIQTL